MLSIKDVFLKSQKNESKRRGKDKRYATQTTNIRKSQRGYFNTRQHRLKEVLPVTLLNNKKTNNSPGRKIGQN